MNSYLIGRLKEGRKKAGLTQAEVAERLGMKRSTLAGYESGNSEPAIDIYIDMCKLYGLDYVNILSAAYELEPVPGNPEISDEEKSVFEKYRMLSEYDRKTISDLIDRLLDRPNQNDSSDSGDYLTLTFYGGRPSAGTGNWLPDETSMSQSQIQVVDSPKTRKADFVLEVDGSSMEPKFSDGDMILVKSQNAIDVGEIGVFQVNGQAVVKQCQEGYLHSLNPSYDDIQIDENDDVICFGKVIGKI